MLIRPNSGGRSIRSLGDPVEEPLVEQPGGHGDGEDERRDGEVQAAAGATRAARRRTPRPRRPRHRPASASVRSTFQRRARSADVAAPIAKNAHLAERDLPRPARSAPRARRTTRAKAMTALALMTWSTRSTAGTRRSARADEHDPRRQPDRAPSTARATGRGDSGRISSAQPPRRRLRHVGAAHLDVAALQQRRSNTAAPMIGVDEERARRVPRDAVLEHAEGDRGDRDRREVAELPDRQRGDAPERAR